MYVFSCRNPGEWQHHLVNLEHGKPYTFWAKSCVFTNVVCSRAQHYSPDQFLFYLLFKIFLKEVINSNGNESCSCFYFMKTIVFCVIQNDNHMAWVPENLLMCFWTCFKLLISWVNRGESPNFFIPQNNMFRVKVVGQNQVSLFDQLFGLYCKGILVQQ